MLCKVMVWYVMMCCGVYCDMLCYIVYVCTCACECVYVCIHNLYFLLYDLDTNLSEFSILCSQQNDSKCLLKLGI